MAQWRLSCRGILPTDSHGQLGLAEGGDVPENGAHSRRTRRTVAAADKEAAEQVHFLCLPLVDGTVTQHAVRLEEHGN